MLTELEIFGLRGFATKQTLTFAMPDKTFGSGLTVLVGPNNAGKSTVIEALSAIIHRKESPPSFSQGRRNLAAGDFVRIRATGEQGKATVLETIRTGTSGTRFSMENGGIDPSHLLVLPSRRGFRAYFGHGEYTRGQYVSSLALPAMRENSIDHFSSRLFAIEKNREAFNAVLEKVLNPLPEWTIDQIDTGQYFLKMRRGMATHSSEGLGEGLLSLFFIIDALYDSKPGDTIAIDEPELSLHPALQRKLQALFVEYATERQIVISTHSPHFTSLDALQSGASVARIHMVQEASKISQLTSATAKRIFGLMANMNNPHILGLKAQEIFFIDDQVILVEGQDDVTCFKKIEQQLAISLAGTFFGWGVGGAGNMEHVVTLLHELGFSKVVGILDNNKEDVAHHLSSKFPEYHFLALPVNDVRTKPLVAKKPAIIGLLDEQNKIRPEYADQIRHLFKIANKYLGNSS